MSPHPPSRHDSAEPSRRRFLKTLCQGTGVVYVAGQASSVLAAPAAAPSQRALVEVLNAVGKPPRRIVTPDGTTVVLLPYGGRVLGLYAPGSDENFYWTHPALLSAEAARAFYGGTGWHNSGGDRTWLAPEVDVFLPHYPSRDGYTQPKELDPGNYRVDSEGGGARLVNRFALTLSRSGRRVELELTKSVAPAANPLRHERNLAVRGVDYAGYSQRTSLAIVGEEASNPVGLWNLVQMPHGGELLVPTYARATPKLVFGHIPASDLAVSDRLVRYRMRQTGEHKLALRAVATAGRVGYVFEQSDRWVAIVRNFVVDPSGEYVDVPWDDPADFGYSTQACNVHSALGQFSELEYHIPAIGGATGRSRCEDVAQVWAYRGPKEAMAVVVRTLLGADLT